MSADVRTAFLQACKNAEPAKAAYLTLYVDRPFYGGPEEGGWWGADTEVVAHQRFESEEVAYRAREEVLELAKQLSENSRDAFNRRCAIETEWLEARGLDDSFLPEVDGEDRYWVAVEEQLGSYAAEGSRHYE